MHTLSRLLLALTVLGLLSGCDSGGDDDGDAGNSAPVAGDSTHTTGLGTPVTFDVAASDADGQVLILTIVAAPANGTLTLGSGLSVTYTPTGAFAGTDTFEYQVEDPDGATDTGLVSVQVGGTGLPDLVITTLTITDSSDTSVDFDWRETNQNAAGGASAGMHGVLFYLSANNTYEEDDDILIGAAAVNSLAANTSTTLASESFTFVVPDGDWTLLAVADEGEAVGESNETNNVRAATILITVSGVTAPDLAVTQAEIVGIDGNELTVSFAETNQGDGDAGLHAMEVFLSLDQTLDKDEDHAITNEIAGSLAAAASITVTDRIVNVEWLGIPPGTYYMIVVTDDWGVWAESDETNNRLVSSTTVVVPALHLPNLTVSAFDVLGSDDNSLTVRIIASNESLYGANPDGGVSVALYASTDLVYDLDLDTVLHTWNLGTIAAYGDVTVGPERVDALLPNGTYSVIAVLDPDDVVGEFDELDNIAVVAGAVTVARTQADLIGSIDGTSYDGANGTFTWTVRNIGGSSAGASTARVYLSPDAVIEGTDYEVGSISVGALAAGGADGELDETMPISGAIPDGDYYLGIIVDTADVVSESSEANNWSVALPDPDNEDDEGVLKIRSLPDLVAEGFQVTHLDSSGITAIWVATNDSPVAPGVAVTVAIVASTDQAYDTASDTVLWSDTVTFGAPDFKFDFNLQITSTWSDLVAGSYYLALIVDSDDDVDEGAYEDNNIYEEGGFVTPHVRDADPDLKFAFAHMAARTSSSITMEFQEANVSLGDAAAHEISVYLSSNPASDPTEITVGTITVGALGGESWHILRETLTMPSGLTDDVDYQVVMIIDEDVTLTEIDTSNNQWISDAGVASQLIQKRANPDIALVGAFPARIANTSIEVAYVVSNPTSEDAGAHAIRIYLSADQNLDAGDLEIYSVSKTGMEAFAADIVEDTITVDWSTAPTGVVYGYISLDDDDDVTEEDEDNVTLFLACLNTAAPDIEPSLVEAVYIDGSKIEVHWEETNTTTHLIGSHAVGVYLDTDAIAANGLGRLLGETTVDQLDGIEAADGILTSSLSGVAYGTYYLAIRVDDNGDVPSEVIGNNILHSSAPIEITGDPDLTYTTPGPNPEVDTAETDGEYVTFTYSVTNETSGPSGDFLVRFYVSANTTVDGGDAIIGTLTVPSLSWGQTYSQEVVLPLPSGVSANRYLGMWINPAGVSETDTTNNTSVDPTPFWVD